MPPAASSNLPSCWRTAPVNAPFSWPNSVLSTRSRGIAARFTGMNGPSGRSPSRWISRATSSLPVPLSPSTSTVADSFAIRWTRSTTLLHRLARPDDELAVRLGDLGAQRQHLAVQVLVVAGVAEHGQQFLAVARPW